MSARRFYLTAVVALMVSGCVVVWVWRDRILKEIDPYLQLMDATYSGKPDIAPLVLSDAPEFEQEIRSNYDYIYRILLSVEVALPPTGGELHFVIYGEKGEILGENRFSFKEFQVKGNRILNIRFPPTRYPEQTTRLRVRSDLTGGALFFPLIEPHKHVKDNRLRVVSGNGERQLSATLKLISYGKANFEADEILAKIKSGFRDEAGFVISYLLLLLGVLGRVIYLGFKISRQRDRQV